MTEIPEHLLKRSRDRRAALGLGGDDAGNGGDDAAAKPAADKPATTAGSAPAPAASTAPAGRAAAPAPAAPPPPKPDTPVVAAYKQRRRVPFWAMAALGVLPVWAFLYARALTEQPEEVAGPIGIGAEVYASCQSCHPGGNEGVGYAFAGGEVLETFPHIEDQIRYVYFGTEQYNIAGVEIYGNPDREGGPHITGARNVMPGFGGELTDEEILSVVCHERFTLGGADPSGDYAEEYETWCSEEAPVFADLEAGGALADLDQRVEGVMPIGNEPIPGSPPSE
ncbi:MAG: hypothetical protein CL424_13915 [Acidimicrobiaceae bacterium]|nr:hypothetical protein [Acidimicrobiaceae bacterium]